MLPEVDRAVETDLPTGNRLLKLKMQPGTLDVRLDACVDVVHHLVAPAAIEPVAPSTLPVVHAALPHGQPLLPDGPAAAARVGPVRQAAARLRAGAGDLRVGPGPRHGSARGARILAPRRWRRINAGDGVCRDFAHLAITLCRALNYPARFVTGVDYGADPALGPPDFHAYVEVYLDRWYLFDPTGISPTTGLIRIGTGADAADVSFATIFGPVRVGMPELAFDAVEDEREGIARPQRTPLAVSTALV